MARRRRVSRRKSKRSFSRGNKVNKRNMQLVNRGGGWL